MAKIKNNPLLKGMSGKYGDVIYKQYSYGTVQTKMPDRSNVKLSEKQKTANGKFKEAVAYAKSIINDPKKRKAYEKKLKRGKTVYHTAVAEYLKKLR